MSGGMENDAGRRIPVAQQDAGRTLDPADWNAFRKQAHRMLDEMLDYTEKIRERPVWQPIPTEVRERRRSAVPQLPSDLAAVHAEFLRDIVPYAAGNVHPGFMGWVHGGGTPVGMLAEMLAAGLNANLGGRNQIPVEVEREVVRWMRTLFGFPESASGLFVTGTSLANLIAVVVARDAVLGQSVRTAGVAMQTGHLTAYASTGVHGCIGKAMDIVGLGSESLRSISADASFRIDLNALEEAVRRDRAAGLTPFLVVGNAGTVDTGAIDDLCALADFCRRERLWFHIDGAYGALARLASDLAPRLNGIERADSLSFDFHKWGQVPYDAGFILVRDGELQRAAFSNAAAYLKPAERGLAAGAPWPCEYGPDLSRGFRALKVWFTLKVYGTEALGAAISRTCQLARHLEVRIAATPELELLAPVALNIVCFRYRAEKSDSINDEIVIRLQEAGNVVPSTTRIAGRLAIRAAIVNHRTSKAEIDALVDGTLALGRVIAAEDHLCADDAEKSPPPLESHSAALTSADQRLLEQPHARELLLQRASALESLGHMDEALETYGKLIALDPAHPEALNKLGILLGKTGRNDEAIRTFSLAVASHPDDLMSLLNYANSLRKSGDAVQAQEHFERALRVDANAWQAHLGLSDILADRGDSDGAALHRRAAFQGRCVVPLAYRGEGPPITVLELVSIGAGNTRLKLFLSDRYFKRFIVTTEFCDDSTQLPPHDLVVNAIGDADSAHAALLGAQALMAHTMVPVINPPAAVLATGRSEIARRLAGIPGVVTARTVTLPRHLLVRSEASVTLAEHGLIFPLLLRTPGFHGGENFLRVDRCVGLADAVAALPGDELMAIEYLDARDRDGKTRKYRVMMIGGELYPLHAAISHHWKIHYYSAEMMDSREHRAEDQAFLQDMAKVLGAPAMHALKAIQVTLGLDYCGIDFSLNEQGDLLVFEANATMTVVPPGEDKLWEYRRPAVALICQAVHEMLVGKVNRRI